MMNVRGTRWLRVGASLAVLVGLVAVAVPVAQRRYGQSTSYYGNVEYDGRFTFVRMSYSTGFGRGFRGQPPWAHDYPAAEYNFLKILTAITNVSAHLDETSIMTYDDPELFKFPVVFMVEPGFWYMSDAETEGLRNYLAKGGFLIVDDFPREAWYNFEQQMARVFPEKRWIQIGLEHPIFNSFFVIDPHEVPQSYDLGGPPEFWALFEHNDPKSRMLVIANYQNDLGEFWEFADQGRFFVDETNESYKVGINQFIYGITH